MNAFAESPQAPLDSMRLRRRADEIKREWAAGGNPNTLAVLTTEPDLLGNKSVVIELAYEEYCLRRQAGEVLDADAFCDRFPAHRNSLRQLVAAHEYFENLPPELPPPPEWPAPGETFGDFTLLRELGRGAFARVYLATEATAGDRHVVVKLLQESTAEPHTLGKLSHPNIVPVLWARPAVGSDGFALLCMPFLGSATLHDLLDAAFPRPDSPPPAAAAVILQAIQTRTQPDDPALDAAPMDRLLERGGYDEGIRFLARQIAEALAFVHARGIVHRDLKPSNVLLGPGGRPLLLDFNLCADHNAPGLRIGGTLPYMAPEQLRALLPKASPETPDGRADLFALGIMLYELLSGRHPFGPVPRNHAADELAEMLLERQRAGCVPLRRLNPRIDPALALLVERCLAFDPRQRPAGAAAVVAELSRQQARARRKRTLVRVACGLALALTAAVGLAAMMPARPDHNVLGQVAFTARDYPAAIKHFQVLLEDDANKNNPRLRLALGRALLKQGERLRDQALRLKNEARWVKDTDLKSTGDKMLASAKDLLNDAAAQLSSAQRHFLLEGKADKADEVQACLAYVLLRRGEANHALPLHDNLIDTNGHRSAILYNNRGNCRSRLGEIDKAFQDFDQALRLDPDLQAARYNRAFLALNECIRRGLLAPLPAQAIDDIEVALKQDPVSHELYGVAALIYARAAEDADRQRKAIWAAVALDPPLDGTICSRPPRSDSSIRIGVGSRWAGSSGPAVRLRVVACNARRDALLRRAVDLARLAIESGEHPGFLSRQPSPVPLLQSHPESRKLLQITGAESGVTSPLVLDPLGDRLGLE